MNIQQIRELFARHADSVKAAGAKAYMRDQFEYFGIQTPVRKSLLKPLWGEKAEPINWRFVFDCWAQPEREFQYVAMEYLTRKSHQLTADDIPNIRRLVLDKSWWDSIDALCNMVGQIVLRDSQVKQIMLDWSMDDNFWIRRMALQHQLLFRTRTDTQLLSTIICNNFGSKEFFINKSIGWVLREYAKTDPDWVRAFIDDNREQMSKLSIREASKHLRKQQS